MGFQKCTPCAIYKRILWEFHWGHLVGNYGIFVCLEQYLQSWLGLVVVSQLVTVGRQNIKHVWPSITLDPHPSSALLETGLSCLFTFDVHTSCLVLYCFWGPWWQSGNTLTSHLWGWGSVLSMVSSGKAGSCLLLVRSLQYRTLTNCMYWFPLPFQLPIMISPVQCWKRRKPPNK